MLNVWSNVLPFPCVPESQTSILDASDVLLWLLEPIQTQCTVSPTPMLVTQGLPQLFVVELENQLSPMLTVVVVAIAGVEPPDVNENQATPSTRSPATAAMALRGDRISICLRCCLTKPP